MLINWAYCFVFIVCLIVFIWGDPVFLIGLEGELWLLCGVMWLWLLVSCCEAWDLLSCSVSETWRVRFCLKLSVWEKSWVHEWNCCECDWVSGWVMVRLPMICWCYWCCDVSVLSEKCALCVFSGEPVQCCIPKGECSFGWWHLSFLVDAWLWLHLVGVKGPEGHREPLVPIGLSCVGAAQLGDTKFLTLLMRGFRT